MLEIKNVWNGQELQTINQMVQAFSNNGLCERDGHVGRIQVNDLLSTPDATRFIPAVVETVVREALEPNLLVVPSLFQEVMLEAGRSIQIGAIGAMYAADIREGGEYPERQMDLDGGDMVAITVGKSGIMVRVTDEMIEDSQFDVIGLWLRMAGRALARHKEIKALKLLDSMGITLFDNKEAASANPTGEAASSEYGITTGRGIDGAQNGTMSTNDLFEMYSYSVTRGFTPNVLLLHPLAWKVFMTDEEMREVVLQGNTVVSNRLPDGSPAPAWATSHGKLGLRTTATGAGIGDKRGTGPDSVLGKIGANPWVQTLNPLGATFNIAPRYLPSPLTVLVTPYVPYTPSAVITPTDGYSSTDTRVRPVCSVMLCDSENTGVLVTKDRVSTEEFDDPARDIRALKIRERYGFGLNEQGKSVMLARNVVIDRNYVFENVNQIALKPLTHIPPSDVLVPDQV